VEVTTEAILTEALAVPTVMEAHLKGSFTINDNHTIPSLHMEDSESNITIAPGAEVTVDIAVVFGTLIVNGTLKGNSKDAEIRLHGDSKVTLNGTTIVGPEPRYFQGYNIMAIARVIPWTGAAWGTPYLYDTYEDERDTFATAITTVELEYLAETYPDLKAIHLYGGFENVVGFSSFLSDYEIDVSVPVSIHGDQTFGVGDDIYATVPVVIRNGVTLTVKSGAEVRFVSDDRTKNAIIGMDGSSKIVVEPGADVYRYYMDEENSYDWEAGTYTWNAGDGKWDKQ
jgi:hypothetical protein